MSAEILDAITAALGPDHGVAVLTGPDGWAEVANPDALTPEKLVDVHEVLAHYGSQSRTRAAILRDLADLDVQIAAKSARILEDLALGNPVHGSVQALFDQKATLRVELAAMG